MSNLLAISRPKIKRRDAVPLWLELPVAPETAPYLVTSTSSLVWINQPHPGDVVKAAVRKTQPSALFSEVVEQVASMGRQMKWGNIHPYTPEGLRAAIGHLEFYGFQDLELLIPRQKMGAQRTGDGVDVLALVSPALRPLVEDLALPLRPSSWVPEDCVVVVPKDRAYVGLVSVVAPNQIAALVHNAARGIALAWGSDELVERPSQNLDPDRGP